MTHLQCTWLPLRTWRILWRRISNHYMTRRCPLSGILRLSLKSLATPLKAPLPLLITWVGDDDEEKFGGVDELFSNSTTDTATISTSPKEVDIPKDKYMSLFQPWRGALILKLLGKIVSFRVLQQRTSDLWGLQWGYELIDIENGFFLARFFSLEDFMKVLEGGPWWLWVTTSPLLSGGRTFVPPQRGFPPRFPELPIELFDEEVLTYMGDAVGKTVRVDETTMAASWGRYGHVCVEIDLDAPLVPVIKVLGSVQQVEYEGLHLICFGCRKYGHRQEVCSDATPSGTEAPPPQPEPLPPATTFGPWMLPKSTSRRQQRLVVQGPSPPQPMATPSGRNAGVPQPMPTVSGTGEEGSNPIGSRFPTTATLGSMAGPNHKHCSSRPPASQFQVLADLPDEPDLGGTLRSLKTTNPEFS